MSEPAAAAHGRDHTSGGVTALGAVRVIASADSPRLGVLLSAIRVAASAAPAAGGDGDSDGPPLSSRIGSIHWQPSSGGGQRVIIASAAPAGGGD